MKITWLGQAGIMFETKNTRVILDPYLSNSCVKLNPNSYRRVKADESLFSLKPDIIICTHNHQDHYDEESLDPFLKGENAVTCIVPPSVFARIRHYGPKHNYIYFPPRTVWTQNNIKITSVKAVHSDPDAIGVIIEAEGKKYYVTGDTLYNEDIFTYLPDDIDVLFMPVNGVGNNMNFTDAKNFAARVNAKKVVPMHLGMLDDRSVAEFEYETAVIPEIYKEIRL